ncbi:MAG: hypothetical protein AVDCRST_MAG93-9429 [uncultured Chloroflexia bacterium]|uniref:Uncharacterized protein n=1 Tax=uncultured Chloroflexia bacterium TaxID=1672391 RepID=A0A6J4NED8_9CHLR|nr:MAG: hypothetical protein AVDCRST_MAG93-9429 [uncultured Chloroflexia bacterium]
MSRHTSTAHAQGLYRLPGSSAPKTTTKRTHVSRSRYVM